MWRPLPLASFSLDAALFGTHVGHWHWVNLILHLASALFVGLLASHFLRSLLCSVFAGATFLVNPWSAEITLWLVGRFDAWASAGVACALWAAARQQGFDRWLALYAVAAVVAFLSKESAMLLPALTLFLVLVDCRPGVHSSLGANGRSQFTWRLWMGNVASRWPLVGLALGLLLLYLVVRHAVLGTISANAYGASSATLTDFVQWSERLGRHGAQFWLSVAQHSLAAFTIATLGVVLLFVGLERCRSDGSARAGLLTCGVFGALQFTGFFVGSALHLDAASVWSDGARLYYPAVLGMALFAAGLAFAAMQSNTRAQKETTVRYSIVFAGMVILIGALAVSQNAVNQRWSAAAVERDQSLRAIAAELRQIPSEHFALVMLADSMGAVPLFRNTQGAAIIEAHSQNQARETPLSHMVAMLPQQIDEWYGLAQTDIVPKIAARVGAPLRPTRYYCKEVGLPNLKYLGDWQATDLETWRAQWHLALQTHCPSLKL